MIPAGHSGSSKTFNIADASTSSGPVAVGDGSRAIQVNDGGTYIEKQYITVLPPEERLGALWQVPFARNPRFVGREEQLNQLHQKLQAQPRQPVGLHGMGGMGKTQLAVEYAFRAKDEYPHGVFWLTAPPPDDASPQAAWQIELARVAGGLGYKLNDPNRSDANLLLAQIFLAHVQANPRALLVVDNLNDAGQLFRPSTQTVALAGLPCALIFTTRQRNPAVNCAWLNLAALPEADALQLLLRHASRRLLLQPGHPQRVEAVRLVRALGCLPLALELAGAYLDKYLNITPGQYLRRIEQEGVLRTIDQNKLRAADLPTGHAPSLAAALGLQWEALADPAARLALQTAALFPEAAPLARARLALFSGLAQQPPAPGYPSALEDALADLANGAWVEELDAAQVRLHPLVAEFARGQTPDLPAFRRAAAGRLAAALADPAALAANLLARGVAALLEDLRLALDFAGDKDLPGAPGGPGLNGLYRALLREAHTLRRWQPDAEPGFFLQQWHSRALEGGWPGLARRCEQELEARRLPHLRELRPLGGESEALVCTLAGHSHIVTAVAMTQDGRRAVSGSDDCPLKVWDLESGSCLATLAGHSSDVDTVAVTPDGRRAVSGSDDCTLKVWDLESGVCLATLAGHSDCVNAVAVTPDERRAVSGSGDKTLKVWDLASGTCLLTLETTAPIRCLSITPDGYRLVVWDGLGRVHFLELHIY